MRADPPAQSSRRELAEQVEIALAALPPKLRAILTLCDLEGVSYLEAAHIERIPVGTVKSRLFSARRALRRLLEPYLEQGAALFATEPGGEMGALWQSP